MVSSRRDQIKSGSARRDLDFLGVEIALGQSVGKNFGAALLADLHQLLAVFVVGIEHGRARRFGAAAFEQYLLGGKILFHGVVIVEVVAGEIGEDRDIERNSVDPLLLQRVRGDFHHGFGRALAQRLVQNAIQFQRFRRSVRRGQDFSGNVIFDGPDQRALAAGGGQDRFEQECGRAFSVRAGDAGDGQPLGGLLVKVGAQSRQRAASVRNLRPGHVRARLFGR